MEETMMSHVIHTHFNPDTMHPDAFQPSKEFIEWLDVIGNSTIANKED